jgi:hypothetical protein
MGPDEAGIAGGSAAQNLDAADVEEVVGGQLEPAQMGGVEARVQSAREGALAGLGLLQDLLQHVVGVGTAVVGILAPGDRRGALGGGLRVERRGAEAFGVHDGQLAVVEVDDLARVPHQGGDIRGHEHLPGADAQDHGAPVAGHHELVRLASVHDRDPVCALHRAERRAHRLLEIARLLLAGARDQVHEHLGVGLRLEHAARGLEPGP